MNKFQIFWALYPIYLFTSMIKHKPMEQDKTKSPGKQVFDGCAQILGGVTMRIIGVPLVIFGTINFSFWLLGVH